MAGFLVIIFLMYTGWVLFLMRGQIAIFQTTQPNNPFVSVIVAAHNEESHLEALLASLQKQTYPAEQFEIILADDRSTDGTSRILKAWQKKLANLRVVRIDTLSARMPAKKFALTRGIQTSRGEILLFTDADCLPDSAWISTTLSYFTDDTGLVVGFAPLRAARKNLLSRLLEIESVYNSLVARAGLAWNIPMTATGRNLAYRKSVFNQVGGFEAISHSISGDDDLFLHLVHKQTRDKMVFANHPGSTVLSFPPSSWKHFFRQRMRHLSAGKYYNPLSQLLYGFFHLSNTLLLLSPIFLFWNKQVPLILALLLAKFSMDVFLLVTFQKSFKYKTSLYLLVFWEYFYLAEVWVIGILSRIFPVTWKEPQTPRAHAE
ncbi:MAG: glycosyltransferase [Calditrichaeota bacterium]|nr:glycosyltransferase [Calditrichota bacterium]